MISYLRLLSMLRCTLHNSLCRQHTKKSAFFFLDSVYISTDIICMFLQGKYLTISFSTDSFQSNSIETPCSTCFYNKNFYSHCCPGHTWSSRCKNRIQKKIKDRSSEKKNGLFSAVKDENNTILEN